MELGPIARVSEVEAIAEQGTGKDVETSCIRDSGTFDFGIFSRRADQNVIVEVAVEPPKGNCTAIEIPLRQNSRMPPEPLRQDSRRAVRSRELCRATGDDDHRTSIDEGLKGEWIDDVLRRDSDGKLSKAVSVDIAYRQGNSEVVVNFRNFADWQIVLGQCDRTTAGDDERKRPPDDDDQTSID